MLIILVELTLRTVQIGCLKLAIWKYFEFSIYSQEHATKVKIETVS